MRFLSRKAFVPFSRGENRLLFIGDETLGRRFQSLLSQVVHWYLLKVLNRSLDCVLEHSAKVSLELLIYVVVGEQTFGCVARW